MLEFGYGRDDERRFVKIIRSGARDDEGELPAEVWAERDTAPTMNAMDNTGDSRATVSFRSWKPRRDRENQQKEAAGIGNDGDPMFTLQCTEQHGVFALQDGREIEKAQNGLGIGYGTAFTLDRTGAQSVCPLPQYAASRRWSARDCRASLTDGPMARATRHATGRWVTPCACQWSNGFSET